MIFLETKFSSKSYTYAQQSYR